MGCNGQGVGIFCSAPQHKYIEAYKVRDAGPKALPVVNGRLLCCTGLGMNEDELRGNKVLTEWVVKDLNEGDVPGQASEWLTRALCQLFPS